MDETSDGVRNNEMKNSRDENGKAILKKKSDLILKGFFREYEYSAIIKWVMNRV